MSLVKVWPPTRLSKERFSMTMWTTVLTFSFRFLMDAGDPGPFWEGAARPKEARSAMLRTEAERILQELCGVGE